MEFLGSQAVQSLIESQASLHVNRIAYNPEMPAILNSLFSIQEGGPTACLTDPETCKQADFFLFSTSFFLNYLHELFKQLFPNTFGQPKLILTPNSGVAPISPLIGRAFKVGVVFSGGPASGGHNVLTGLLDFMKGRNQQSELIGFLGGPSGIVNKKFKVITFDDIAHFRNLGGFHFLGSGRTKIETEEQLRSSMQNCTDLNLDGLVVIGGDDSNTNAAILAEYFIANGCKTKVIGCPKTIDGDLRNEDIEASFGFDTATKEFAGLGNALVDNCCYESACSSITNHQWRTSALTRSVR